MSRIRIAVLADTHNRMPQPLVEAVKKEADAIWHLGDVMNPGTLEPLERTGLPLLVIRGNNDFETRWPLHRTLEFGKTSFHLVHIRPWRLPPVKILLHGHTHVPCDEVVDGVRVLNPGTAGLPNKGAPTSFAWIDLEESTGAMEWTLVPLCEPSL